MWCIQQLDFVIILMMLFKFKFNYGTTNGTQRLCRLIAAYYVFDKSYHVAMDQIRAVRENREAATAIDQDDG